MSEQTRLLALRSTLPEGAVISHDSAAALYGLPASLFPDGCLHISLTVGEPVPRRKELVVHSRHLPPDDYCKLEGLLVTTPERTFLDLAARATGSGSSLSGMRCFGRDGPRRTYCWIGCRPRTGFEGCAWHEAWSLYLMPARNRRRRAWSGLECVTPACRHQSRSSRSSLDDVTVHIDLGYDAAKVGIEYEGAQHAEQYQFGIDIDRYSALAAHGWLILRAGRRDLGGKSRRLIERTRSALRSRGVAC